VISHLKRLRLSSATGKADRAKTTMPVARRRENKNSRMLGHGFACLAEFLLISWATMALYFDFSIPSGRLFAAVIFATTCLSALVFCDDRWRKLGVAVIAFVCVLAWWLSLRPSNDRNWQPDVAQTAWAEIHGDQVTIHNFRICDYRTETDYTSRWETKTISLSQLRGLDVFITYWGSPWIAHPIISFNFGDQGYVAMSVETRKEVAESYSAIRGFFRYYELIYIISDERDVVRLRTNVRKGEDVYLYHTRATPEQARIIFLDYLNRANRMRSHPEWYNAVTNNCTTNIASHVAEARAEKAVRWDWRILLNGKADEMMYERGDLVGDLPFTELKKTSYINPLARAADVAIDFSASIRKR
jgi:Domain of unknown function (DUF4105)